jgi:hypothetical protein
MASGGDGGAVHDEKWMPQQLQPAGVYGVGVDGG